MSVLSRTTQRTHETTLPQQRSGPPRRTPLPPAGPGRARTAGLLAAGIVVLGAAGTATWSALDDGPTTPGPVSPGVLAPGGSVVEQDVLSERVAREAQRDNARAGTFG